MSAYNGSGTFVVSGVGLPYVTATTISSTVANQLNTDLATGLSTAICKDGQTTTTARIPFAVGASFADSIIYGGVTLANSVTGTGSMVLGTAPTISGHPTIEGITSTGATGTGKLVYSISPTLTGTAAFAALTTSGTIVSQGDITCANGSIVSGNNVSAAGFNVLNTLSWTGNQLTSATPANYQIVARTNGVQLNDGATSWSAISDERKKADLVAISGALAKLATWRTVIGRFAGDPVEKRHPFLLAQDVQATTPEAVSANEDGTLLLSYTDTIPDIVAAINELAARVTALET